MLLSRCEGQSSDRPACNHEVSDEEATLAAMTAALMVVALVSAAFAAPHPRSAS